MPYSFFYSIDFAPDSGVRDSSERSFFAVPKIGVILANGGNPESLPSHLWQITHQLCLALDTRLRRV
jgi:hypothetical protein